MFKRIGRSDTLRQQVGAHIKKLIDEGKLKPGDRLPTEKEMAAEFGVSRTVIRDAVKTLSGNGLVVVQHGRGIFINKPDSSFIARQLAVLVDNENDSINQLFEVRLLLETAAARWAAQRHLSEDIALFQDNLMEHQSLADAHDIVNLGLKDREFHLLVAKSTGNPLIIRLMQNILDLLEVSNKKTLYIPGRAQQSIQEHEQIITAILQRNAQNAEVAMHQHLQSVANSLKSTVTPTPDQEVL